MNNDDKHPTNRRFVRRICEDLQALWDKEFLTILLSSEVGFNKIVSIVNELYKNGDIKDILKKIIACKDVTQEERDRFNLLMNNAQKYGKSEYDKKRVEKEYTSKKRISEGIKITQSEMKENFYEVYDKYIDLLLEGKGITEDVEKIISDTNEEIITVLNKKINKIIFDREILKLLSEQDQMEGHVFLEKLQKINELNKL
jgi:hypothetical protein